LEVFLLGKANVQNLRVPSSEEAREIGRKGGIASGEARQKRKALKEELLLLLAEGDTQKSVTLALIEKAMGGDTKAFEVIRDTIGEKPVEKVVISEIDTDVIDEVERMVNDDEKTSS
jgi:hypothetical protein